MRAARDRPTARATRTRIRASERLDIALQQALDERARIARILAEFAAAPISMASLQPVLDLAAELNKEPR